MSQLLEEILSRENMMRAYKRVVANKGASGVDGITTDEVKEYLIGNWEEIREQIRNRKYKPQPVRRVEIPKPNGGVRNLGIPSVVDRIIEQAIAQRLTPIVEPLFSDYSYGFRPKRKAQQAVMKLLEYLNDGYTYIVDIDLEKFFDNVPQDKLMYLRKVLRQCPTGQTHVPCAWNHRRWRYRIADSQVPQSRGNGTGEV